MSLIPHTASERISNFFSGYCSASDTDCRAFASRLVGSSTAHTATQGAFSYTVASMDSVVQFRAKFSPLDIGILDLARKVHGSIVPRTWEEERMPLDNEVLVYHMDRIPGENYARISGPSFDLPQFIARRETTIKAFAKFFAQSWKAPQKVELHVKSQLKAKHEERLRLLLFSLPATYKSLLMFCVDNLDAAFEADIPWTLTHGDLCDTNLMINPDTGELTGIIDWAEGDIQPFGMALWGLETLLGYMDVEKDRWIYYSQRKEMKALFWDSLLAEIGPISQSQHRGILITQLSGTFFRHGFKFDGVREIPKNGNWNLSLLEGQLLGNENEWQVTTQISGGSRD